MKKSLAVILFFIYAAASSGATINFHYCMGKFTGWDVAYPATAKCDNCGMSKEKRQGCCNDKYATIHVNKDQLVAAVNCVPFNHFVYIQHQHPVLIKTFFISKDIAAEQVHSPPLIQPIPSFIRNCVLLI